LRGYAGLFALGIVAILTACGKEKKGKGDVHSVLILGNSIVNHGPAPQIGWTGHWGMAASAQDSDFVHLLMAEIHRQDTAVTVNFANAGGFEWLLDGYDYARVDSLPKADMLILRFSENVVDSTAANGALVRNYDKLIHTLDPDDKAVKVIVTGMWYRPNTHKVLQQYAADHHYIFVSGDGMYAAPGNTAKGLFADTAVAAHPSDQGMRKIKERIWTAIQDYF